MNLIKSFFSKNKRKDCCNHNPLDTNTTLQKNTKKLMVSPDKNFYVCKICQKSFVFVTNEKGELTIENV